MKSHCASQKTDRAVSAINDAAKELAKFVTVTLMYDNQLPSAVVGVKIIGMLRLMQSCLGRPDDLDEIANLVFNVDLLRHLIKDVSVSNEISHTSVTALIGVQVLLRDARQELLEASIIETVAIGRRDYAFMGLCCNHDHGYSGEE